MKICYLADAQSVHTQRWVTSIAAKGHEVVLITYRPEKIAGITVYVLKSPRFHNISPTVPFWSRFHYLFGKKQAKTIIDSFAPDILHAFWATSYGFLGARLGHPNFTVSVWGRDVTDSPKHSRIMKGIIKFVLSRAKLVFCTSIFLLEKTKPLLKESNSLRHIPFGIDLGLFCPTKSVNSSEIIIGSTKSFEEKYGLAILIKAFSRLAQNESRIRLKLVGDGSLKNYMQDLVKKLEIDDICEICTAVSHNRMPAVLHGLDIYVMPSISESETFGVAALEASATGLPVVASNIGGIPEVVIDKVTGILVQPNSIDSLVDALLELIKSRDLRQKYGDAGKLFVKENYQWKNNVQMKINEYEKLLN